jgi:hypothetical protein
VSQLSVPARLTVANGPREQVGELYSRKGLMSAGWGRADARSIPCSVSVRGGQSLVALQSLILWQSSFLP